MSRRLDARAFATLATLLLACAPSTNEGGSEARTAAESPASPGRLVSYTETREPCDDYSPTRMPLFGDLHVHTRFSFDAAANTIGATPADAYRFGQGEAIDFWPLAEDGSPAGRYAMERPLDFLAVTDHGEFLGERRLCREPGSPSYDGDFCTRTREHERQFPF